MDSQPFLNEEGEELRWFLLPKEAEHLLNTNHVTSLDDYKPCPFKPKVYSETNHSTMNDITAMSSTKSDKERDMSIKFHHPPKSIMKNVIEVNMSTKVKSVQIEVALGVNSVNSHVTT